MSATVTTPYTVSFTVKPAAGVQVIVTPTGAAPVVYDLATAKRLDDLVTFAVRQENWHFPPSAALPFLDVFYRRDVPGGRHEVVFELTNATTRSPVNDLPAYSAELVVNGATVLRDAVPIHFWGGRWRLKPPGYRPRVRSIGDLVAAGLLPAMDPIPPAATTIDPYVPMVVTTDSAGRIVNVAGVTAYMPTTGERPDIGVVNAWAAAHISNGDGDAGDWQQQQENAEASGTFPWNFRDETGRIFSIDTHPGWAIDARFADSSAHVAAHAVSPSPKTPVPDGDHQPTLCFVPFMLTGDPYWLEGLQYQANWSMWQAGSSKGLGLVIGYQVRGTAWTLRELAYAAAATPDATASTLLPREYFLRKLANNRRAYAAITMDTVDPMALGFRLPRTPNPQQIGGWQNDMNCIVASRLAMMGFTDWQPLVDWVAPGLLARASGKAVSGWPRSICAWDYLTAGTPPVWPGTGLGSFATTWAGLLQANPDLPPLPPADDVLVPAVVGDGIGDLIGALRLIQAAGHPELDTVRTWVETQRAKQALGILAKMLFAIRQPGPAQPQPVSAGDPMPPASMTMTGPTGHFDWNSGILQVIGQGLAAGQTLTANTYGGSSYQAVWAYPDAPDVFRFVNMHYSGAFFVKGVARVTWPDGRTFDCVARSWL